MVGYKRGILQQIKFLPSSVDFLRRRGVRQTFRVIRCQEERLFSINMSQH